MTQQTLIRSPGGGVYQFLVCSMPCRIVSIVITQTIAAIYFVKLYDGARRPVSGSDYAMCVLTSAARVDSVPFVDLGITCRLGLGIQILTSASDSAVATAPNNGDILVTVVYELLFSRGQAGNGVRRRTRKQGEPRRWHSRFK